LVLPLVEMAGSRRPGCIFSPGQRPDLLDRSWLPGVGDRGVGGRRKGPRAPCPRPVRLTCPWTSSPTSPRSRRSLRRRSRWSRRPTRPAMSQNHQRRRPSHLPRPGLRSTSAAAAATSRRTRPPSTAAGAKSSAALPSSGSTAATLPSGGTSAGTTAATPTPFAQRATTAVRELLAEVAAVCVRSCCAHDMCCSDHECGVWSIGCCSCNFMNPLQKTENMDARVRCGGESWCGETCLHSACSCPPSATDNGLCACCGFSLYPTRGCCVQTQSSAYRPLRPPSLLRTLR
jgi:hypothetical protein